MSDRPNHLNYAAAGVDIEAGNALVDRIKPAAAATNRAGVMAGLGGFGGLFDLKAAGFQDPVLVAATDGVGTKLRIAIDTAQLGTIGQDLVAMCVNDLVCQGAEPLFFLDYFATAKLDVEAAAEVVTGIADGCAIAGCALIGGETAEMPGMYHGDDFDLAGFAVGAMERGAALPAGVAAGDVLIGLPATGIHSNGYSLVRKIMGIEGLGWDDTAPWSPRGETVGAQLLTPTAIYVQDVLWAIGQGGVTGVSHITGGGLTENVPRMLPEGLGVEIDQTLFHVPEIFMWLMKAGGIMTEEMLRTFNCGLGMVLSVREDRADVLEAGLRAERGVEAVRIGHVHATGQPDPVTYTGAFGVQGR